MKDPYKVLGVSPNASDDEIKKVYRDLARKYHPDNYHDNPLSDLAQEKMKEINEAYDTITRQRAAGNRGASSGGYNTNYYNTGSNRGSSEFAAVRNAIAAGNLNYAEQLLNASNNRNAEWHFLMGSVCYRRGWFDEARRYYQTACNMDPSNAEYRQALNLASSGGNAYYRNASNNQPAGGMNACDCCAQLWCADTCCECMGGDLISCC